jgi:3-oxoacyl-[acyl-carrier-protein] synthase II
MGINVGAGLISCDLEEIAPAVANSLTEGKFDIKKWGKEGIEFLTPIWLLKYLPNMLACHIGIIHDIQGPSNTITCGEVSGILSVIEASETILRGFCDVSIAGAAEAKVNPIVMSRQCILKRASTAANENPEGACRPFDKKASGSVFGEGGAMLVLEDLETAKKRAAQPIAEIVGVGESTSLNTEFEHLESDGRAVAAAIKKALADAGINPEQLDLIVPHGTAVPQDDQAESRGIETALGEAVKDIPVFPVKSMLSNTGAASGAIDIAIAAKAIQQSKIPAAKNCDEKSDSCNLNINKKLLETDIRYALCCGYTYGGQTAAVILKNMK